MTSFLAAIEDGIAYGRNVKQRQADQRKRTREGGGELAVPKVPILSSILSLSLRGKIEGSASSENDEEVELVRKHTEASLFIQLRNTLYVEQRVIRLESERDLAQVDHGALVEVTGRILRSPAAAALDALLRLMSTLGLELPSDEIVTADKLGRRSSRNQGKPQQKMSLQQQMERLQSGGDENVQLRLVQRLRDELTTSKIIDVVMRLPTDEAFSVIIALSAEFLPEGALENLLSGHFTVLGKVTRVLMEGDVVNLYQRTSIGALGDNEVFNGFPQVLNVAQATGSAIINAPAVQVIPLAIFV